MGPCELHLVVHYIQYIHTTYICVMYLGAYFRTFAVLGSARIQFGAPSNSLPVTFLQRSLHYNPKTQLLKHFKSKTLRSEFFPGFGECQWRRAQSWTPTPPFRADVGGLVPVALKVPPKSPSGDLSRNRWL